MIKNNEPLSMPQVLEYLKESEGDKEVAKFIKNFNEVKGKDSRELTKKLNELDIIKLKPHDIAKIVDFMPDDNEDLNKIFADARLDEDESKKILDVVKEFK